LFYPYNLKNAKWGEALVAIAGPLSNIAIALIFGVIIRLTTTQGIETTTFLNLTSFVVLINITLAIFNLIPIPPLDGSKILFSILPYRWQWVRESIEQYGMILILIFVFFGWQILTPLIGFFFTLLTGIAF
jgi:Zn-dependent protease